MRDGLSFRTAVQITLASIVLMLAVAYVIFQARYLIVGPGITLKSEPARLQNERQIFLEGTAFNISHLWLNDRQIYTDAKGHFTEALILENGYTVATLRAEDRYGRTVRTVRSFVYSPASFY
ncbi:MAG: hypothetical protein AAB388_00390 [Patescibacteria group bacterium]